MEEKSLGLNPWTSIWTAPRETIRSIVNFNPKFRFIILSFLNGLPSLLYYAQELSLGNTYSIWAIIIGAVILATIIGMISISIGSALTFWTGKWIGGKATYYPVRAAVSWANVTNIFVILVWLLSIFYFREQMFLKGFQQASFTGTGLAIVLVNFLVGLVMSIWSIVILVKGLSEVQGFSSWKAILNVLIPIVIIAIVIFVLGGLMKAFIQ